MPTTIILSSKVQGGDRCNGNRKQRRMETCPSRHVASVRKWGYQLVPRVYTGCEQRGDARRLMPAECHLCSPGGRVAGNMDLSSDEVIDWGQRDKQTQTFRKRNFENNWVGSAASKGEYKDDMSPAKREPLHIDAVNGDQMDPLVSKRGAWCTFCVCVSSQESRDEKTNFII